jgi:hypothetical protein
MLADVVKFLDRQGWGQGEFVDKETGNVCLVGAILAVCHPEDWEADGHVGVARGLHADEPRALDAIARVALTIDRRFVVDGERSVMCEDIFSDAATHLVDRVTAWNDDPDRTFGEITDLLESVPEDVPLRELATFCNYVMHNL